jgi:hypothetical protein
MGHGEWDYGIHSDPDYLIPSRSKTPLIKVNG